MKDIKTRESKARDHRRRARKLAGRAVGLPFTRANYLIFALGIALILVGYWALAQPPADSFMSLTVAPILLIMGYCVVVPVAILYRKRQADDLGGASGAR